MAPVTKPSPSSEIHSKAYPTDRRGAGRLLLPVALLGVLGCSESVSGTIDPTPSTSADPAVAGPDAQRLLGIDVSTPEDGDFNATFSLTKSAGAQFVSLSLAWDSLETEPGVYEPDPNYLAIANQYYPASDTLVSLAITPIGTNINRLPADLRDKPFDHPP